VKQINLRINSPGGEVFDGIAVGNMLARHPAKVTATVDGIAASIASVVCMAADDVVMPENAMMMIHNPAGVVCGTAADMRDWADALEKMSTAMIASYVRKTGRPAPEISAMLDAETWLTAAEAKAKGFADRIIPARRMQAKLDSGRYPNAPAAAIALSTAWIEPVRNAVTADWACGAARDLSIDMREGWDGDAARDRMLDAAGFGGSNFDAAKARRGFLAYDRHNPSLKGSWKLPFADITDGELKAVSGGLRAAASRLSGTDIPDAVRTEARSVIDGYEKRMRDSEGGGATNSSTETNNMDQAELEKAKKDAAAEERQRITAIQALDEAKGREKLAAELAATDGMTAERAKAILAAAPKTGSLEERAGGFNPALGHAPAVSDKQGEIDKAYADIAADLNRRGGVTR